MSELEKWVDRALSAERENRRLQQEVTDYRMFNRKYQEEADQLRAQLWQAEAREAALREAILDVLKEMDVTQPKSLKAYTKARERLYEIRNSFPSQPSRYRESLAVVEIIKKIGLQLIRHHRKECNCLYCQLYDALEAYDKAGEGAGK